MTADQGNSGPERQGFGGFHAYADDTPRDGDAWQAPPRAGYRDTPDDRPGEAWPAEVAPEARRTGRWAGPAAVATLGVALAVAAGIYMGRDPSPTPANAPQPPPAATGEPGMSVEVASVAETLTPPRTPARTEKLEVLPPVSERLAAAAPANPRLAPEPAAPPRPAEAVAAAAPASEPLPESPRMFPHIPPARDAVAVAPSPPPWFECRDAPTLAMSMVCADRGLATLDRRMKQAYVAALDAGAAEDALRADQDDWLAVREEAAHVSRQAVADIYRQRIGELRRVARD